MGILVQQHKETGQWVLGIQETWRFRWDGDVQKTQIELEKVMRYFTNKRIGFSIEHTEMTTNIVIDCGTRNGRLGFDDFSEMKQILWELLELKNKYVIDGGFNGSEFSNDLPDLPMPPKPPEERVKGEI